MIQVFIRYLLRQKAHSTFPLRSSGFPRRLPVLWPLLVALLVFCGFTVAQAADFYVAPAGTPAGNGGISNPWDLQTALNHPTSVRAGDTIWLRGGTYGSGFSTTFTSRLAGTQTQPIVVRQYPGERATVNGSITSNGAYVWFWGFEVTNSNTDRTNNSNRPPGLTLTGAANKIINMVIHDTGHPGIGFWHAVGDGGEIYGTIFWGIGSYNPDAGSAIYAQNKDGTRYIRDTISFKNFTTGFKAFTTNTYANGFHIEGNISFMNGEWDMFTVSRSLPVERLKVIRNFTYRKTGGHPEFQFGYDFDTEPGKDITATDNYFVGATPAEAGRGIVTARLFTNVTFLRNTIVANVPGKGTLVHWAPCVGTCGGFPKTYNWDLNTYYGGSPTAPFRQSGTTRSWDAWKLNTGFDAHSSYFPGVKPTQNLVVVRPNAYEQGRANIIIYNWQNLSSISVNLSDSDLAEGQSYEVKDVQNFYGAPVASGTYSSSNPSASIPMTGLVPTPLLGNVTHISSAHSAPEFGVFVVLRTTATPSPTPTPGPMPTPTATPTPSPTPIPAASQIQLILDQSGPDTNQAAAVDSVLFLRDPFQVVNGVNFFNLGLDRNTRVIILVTNLQLVQGQPASSVVGNLIDSNNQSYDIVAEEVRPVPNFDFTQVIFRLPDNLPAGTCTIRVKALGQTSNAGTIRIKI